MTTPPISRYPVPELKDLPEDIRARILEGIEAVGTDLEFHSPVTGPTIKVAEMTVAGE